MNNFFNKLKFNYNTSYQIKNDILDQKIKNDLMMSSIINQRQSSYFKKILDFSSSWEDLQHNDLLDTQYQIWKIEFPVFDIRLLSAFNIDVLYRKQGGMTADDRNLNQSITKNFSIEDIGEGEYYKKVKIVISIYFYYYQLKEIYQAKLNMFFINPRLYS
jgi:hypothetical protein